MDEIEILYQTYLVTFATASALRRSGNVARFSALVRDVERRAGAQRVVSLLALDDATQPAAEVRTRPAVVSAITERAANTARVRAGAQVATGRVHRR
jgi:hypothetical protein